MMESFLGNVSNFFAVRSVNEFSFDGEKWYKEGEKVHIAPGTAKCKDAIIKAVNDDGTVLFGTVRGDLSCRIRDIRIGSPGEDGIIVYQSGEIIAYSENCQFSINLEEWFDMGQECIVTVGDEILIRAVVKNVFEDGRIVFDYNGNTRVIDYREIDEIRDYQSNTMYLMHDLGSALDVIFFITTFIKRDPAFQLGHM